mmetsp:Transcript_7089/g.12867  ORF Transcript_7089/g.12867 Transcript_7089/m.12867 type:complete len:200 (-) Transcript_7089:2493-3092(-)
MSRNEAHTVLSIHDKAGRDARQLLLCLLYLDGTKADCQYDLLRPLLFLPATCALVAVPLTLRHSVQLRSEAVGVPQVVTVFAHHQHILIQHGAAHRACLLEVLVKCALQLKRGDDDVSVCKLQTGSANANRIQPLISPDTFSVNDDALFEDVILGGHILPTRRRNPCLHLQTPRVAAGARGATRCAATRTRLASLCMWG